jgi:D-alanyl-lipoteichoic acid acyltransferase DltB (MBOAT superfamily)
MAFIPQYMLILLFLIIIDYGAAIYMEKLKKKKRKAFLILSLSANIVILGTFKYGNFILENINIVSHVFSVSHQIPLLPVILPLGLSFHTFQSMSYTIEVYRKKQKAEKNFFVYALYVLFFPQLVAGPIERPQHLLHQFYEKKYIDYERIMNGLQLMAWGFFKKLVIADRAAFFVNQAYSHPDSFSGLSLISATFFFAYQIYCDFSGYTDIARGCARILGFTLIENFNLPYYSASVAEFWRRWHISLSSWFRDYVYIPLGGNRGSQKKQYRNILITFLLSGLWHGANWTFIIWGLLNGIYIIASDWVGRLRDEGQETGRFFSTIRKFISILSTFCFISFAWIFFRVKNLSDAFVIIKQMISHLLNRDTLTNQLSVNQGGKNLLIILVFITLLELIQTIIRKKPYLTEKITGSFFLRIFVLSILIWVTFLFGNFGQKKFIYFTF